MQVVTEHHLILLHSDITALLPLLPSTISSHLRLLLPHLPHSEPLSAVSESVASLSSLLSPLSSSLVTSLTAAPIKQLRGVLDIPRMYRRTNREAPSKPCSYVTAIADTLAVFSSSHSSTLGTSSTSTVVAWLGQAADIILLAYQEQVLAGFLTQHFKDLL